ncbi:MAG: NUDIX hydrolase [Flavimaricola sp.]|nr:NUDIX hydrolase [Flavimaricola sp.]
MDEPFDGAKAAVFIGEHLLVILRDDKPDIPFPANWDFPGGGREPGETGFQTLAREMHEEVGLDAHAAQCLWARRLPRQEGSEAFTWFYILRFAAGTEGDIRFGDEGQGWTLMHPDDFVAVPDAVPSLVVKLRLWLHESGGGLQA